MRTTSVILAFVSFAVALALGATPANAATPLRVSTTTVTVSQDGRSFSARLVQPTGSAARAYPVVAFGHGFTQTTVRYQSILADLASRGYVVIAPNTETGLFPNHGRLADDLALAIRWAQRTQPNAHPSVDAVSGHSMGGGAALLAADRSPSIDSVITFAAAETRPSATVASGGIDVPAMFVVGSQDRIVRPETTRQMYAAKPSPATFASITGGYHCGFLDSSSLLGFGCDSGSISRSAQLAVTRTLLGDWLDMTLKGAAARPAPAGVVVETT
jgi:dienelactone hydrolase